MEQCGCMLTQRWRISPLDARRNGTARSGSKIRQSWSGEGVCNQRPTGFIFAFCRDGLFLGQHAKE